MTISAPNGKVTVGLKGVDMKAIVPEALPGKGLELTCKLQSQIDIALFEALWAIQIDGKAHIEITEMQLSLEGAGNDGPGLRSVN